ncbi:MAG: arginine--tRNA ligase [Oscillospiraceae bacterium]|jgi:arginyl-tRNA synthetase|nr:arginine--tRNA ligase [Oscillospiraceae bacterium]
MSYLVSDAQEQLRGAILQAAQKAALAGELPAAPAGAFLMEIPSDRANGDLSSNAALTWARELRLAPRKIAETLQKHLVLEGSYALRCETAGPGFLNFYYNDRYFAEILRDILVKGEAYGCSDFGQGKRINVEFVSANPTGPMHMGNARGGALGDCLAAVLEAAGYVVKREFYVNDAGNQIEKFALSLDIRYRQHCGEEIELPEDCYQGEDITDLAQQFAQSNGIAALQLPEGERRKALVDFALPKNMETMRKNIEKYRICYDTWFRESHLYQSGEVERVITLLRESGNCYESEGALWFRATDFGLDKDFVLVRSNGLPTYIVPDIAYHYNKLVTRGFDRAIDVLGSDHHGYALRLKAILPALGIDAGRLDIILMQLVRLTRKGETVRMSKRSGKAITLEDLLEEIPIDAVRFLFNMREPATQMEFDLDLALEQSAQNPVYYCQYAHARICSIFRKLAEEGITPRVCTKEELCKLSSPEERELIHLLSSLTGEIIHAAQNYDPARVTRFCMELSAQFHKFYAACRVRCEDEALMQARLMLCACVRDTLANLLGRFKISAPEQM